MVDCTLDDYIGQKGTFSVQLTTKSVNVGNNFRGSGGFQRSLNVRGGFQRKMNIRGGFQRKINIRGGFQQNANSRGGFQQNANSRGGFQQNANSRGGFQQNRGGFQQNSNKRGGLQQNSGNRGGFQQNSNKLGGFQRSTNLRGGFQKTLNRGGFHGNANNKPNTNFAGFGNVKSFDARLRLGPKVTFDARQKLQKKPVDARQMITGPGTNMIKLTGTTSQNSQNVSGARTNFQLVKVSPLGAQNTVSPVTKVFNKITAPESDARSKILKIQIQKGTFDARSLIASKGMDLQTEISTSQKAVPQVNVPGVGEVDSITRNVPMHNNGVDEGVGLLTKTVTNVASDNCITVTNSGLQVTRTVPSSSITFDGSSLKVTKKAHAIESSESVTSMENRRTGTIHFSQSQYSKLVGVSTGDHYDSDDAGLEEDAFPMTLNITRTANIVKTVTNSAVTQTPSSQPVLKRKLSAPVCSGPLKLLKTGTSSYTPTIRVPSISKPPLVTVKSDRTNPPLRKQPKPAVKSVEDIQPENDTVSDVVNPLQGYRVYVTNLHPIVNQDDIIELFGAIGALKKAKLIKQGVAEVVYLNKDDAQKAVVKYNNRELDGQVMMVKLLTSAPAAVKKPAPVVPPVVVPVVPPPAEEAASGDEAPSSEAKGQPLKLRKQVPVSSLGPEPSNVQIPVLHKALFKLGAPTTSNPVTFTVKI
ncbi:uncharacterized protein LOC121378238 [Gigantopelta aegis]|uniref:uncharacterized protein LOC121378238 n=1 Tax=Gigantopelta aegis TaxID=1735272 RepID=UPI001B88B29E|nr:uncharacterized protein LOC121378238 [Gigantopelta aegis]